MLSGFRSERCPDIDRNPVRLIPGIRTHLLATVKIVDTTPQMTKRHRLYNAVANDQNSRQMRTHIIAFIRKAMKPERSLVRRSASNR